TAYVYAAWHLGVAAGGEVADLQSTDGDVVVIADVEAAGLAVDHLESGAVDGGELARIALEGDASCGRRTGHRGCNRLVVDTGADVDCVARFYRRGCMLDGAPRSRYRAGVGVVTR